MFIYIFALNVVIFLLSFNNSSYIFIYLIIIYHDFFTFIFSHLQTSHIIYHQEETTLPFHNQTNEDKGESY